LQVARIAAGLSRLELATKLGLDDAAIRNYEGERSQPTLERLYAIKEYFQWSDFYGAPVTETSLTDPADIPILSSPSDIPDQTAPGDIPNLSPSDVPPLASPHDIPAHTDSWPHEPIDMPSRSIPDKPSRSIPDKPTRAIPAQPQSPEVPYRTPRNLVHDIEIMFKGLLDYVEELEAREIESATLREENERLRERLDQARKFFEESE
jgi:transcriptional regulator with XRE-family HTH domain